MSLCFDELAPTTNGYLHTNTGKYTYALWNFNPKTHRKSLLSPLIFFRKNKKDIKNPLNEDAVQKLFKPAGRFKSKAM